MKTWSLWIPLNGHILSYIKLIGLWVFKKKK